MLPYKEEGDSVLIYVEDDGPGMTEERSGAADCGSECIAGGSDSRDWLDQRISPDAAVLP